MSTIDALKQLAVSIIGGELKAEDIHTSTIPDTINFIAENYPKAESETKTQ